MKFWNKERGVLNYLKKKRKGARARHQMTHQEDNDTAEDMINLSTLKKDNPRLYRVYIRLMRDVTDSINARQGRIDGFSHANDDFECGELCAYGVMRYRIHDEILRKK